MRKEIKVLLIGFLVASIGFGAGVMMASSNISAASNNSAFIAYLNNNWMTKTSTNQNSIASNTLENSYTAPDILENLTDSLNRFQNIMNIEQGIINQGLTKWMTRNITMWSKTLSTTSNNLSALQLFMQFLNENPKYQEHFKNYNTALMKYYEALERKNILEASTIDSHYIIENGQIVKEWNISRTISNISSTIICKEYRIEVNGTLYTAVKAEVYNEDGTLISDPDVYVKAPPYYYWYWFPWPWPFGQIIVYGQDEYIYVHFRDLVEVNGVLYPEMALYLWDVTEEVSVKEIIVVALTIIMSTALGCVPLVGPLLAVFASVAGAYEYSHYEHMKDVLKDTALYNREWGLRTVLRSHWIYGVGPWWDFLSGVTFWTITKDGAWVQAFLNPFGGLGLAYCSSESAAIITGYIYQVGMIYGFNRWVWIGPCIPYFHSWPPV
ncbi:MAG: hypothetical protein QW279_02005 [Candidatus Jordarchaeaceae archaeon]